MAAMKLKQALKEWAVAVDALADGETILLMRKGGIHEPQAHFGASAQPVLLYPTYEHQKPDLLKATYASQVQAVASGWHPLEVGIRAMAQITDVLTLTTAESLAALSTLHIWNERFAIERWRWKPHRPLSILCLRVFVLPQPQFIPYQPHYGGCRSWIELEQAIDIADAVPVLDESAYADQVAAIRSAAA